MGSRKWAVSAAVVAVGLGVAVALLVSRGCRRHVDSVRRIGITQIVSHPSLDEVREGVIEGLRQRGYCDGENVEILFRNANGDPSLTLPIAQDFVRQRVAVIVPITTPSALGAAKSTDRIPIVFGGVTDPVALGLVSDLDKPGGNVTGTSDRWPINEQLAFFRKLLPQLRRLGVLYRPGDDVSAFGVDQLKKYAPKLGIELDIRPVSGPTDIYPSAVALLRNVDAVYTGMDNLVVENLDSLLKAAEEVGKPVLAGDEGAVKRGALASVSVDMKELGILTGHMVADVLDGKDPATLPVRVITSGIPMANHRAVARFKIPEDRLNELKVRLIDDGGRD